MNYLVIDLEMCNVPRDYRSRSYKYANETIQIGAVLLDEEFKRIGTLSQYVHPEHGVIDPFIQNLTGIRNSQVKKAPRIEEALLHMTGSAIVSIKSMPGAVPTEHSCFMKSKQRRSVMSGFWILSVKQDGSIIRMYL